MIGELGDAERSALAALMWEKTRDTLLVVEPGTPAGYARIIALRERLIAAGAHVIAPCPHDGTCPLAAPDWCHFTQRLPRSRAHKQLKGAELPFEDEKFAYVALTRAPVAARPPACWRSRMSPRSRSRPSSAPRRSRHRQVPRRAKADYAARRWRWGDAVEHASASSPDAAQRALAWCAADPGSAAAAHGSRLCEAYGAASRPGHGR